MEFKIIGSLGKIPRAQWNALNHDDNPFVRHEFLHALEIHDCVGAQHGWRPNHFVLEQHGQILAAAPAYIKTHSHGEFVFDWAWAEAYQRHGLNYYPKLISAVPYSPVSGPRLLIRADQDVKKLRASIAENIRCYTFENQFSGMHWLFTEAADQQSLETAGYFCRLGYQFHWRNQGYGDFNDFLNTLTSRKRKKINRERRFVNEQGISHEIKHGDELTPPEWQQVYQYYCSIYDRKWGFPSLTLGFFQETGETLGKNIVVIFAKQKQQIVACAYLLKNQQTLYGRYWGCRQEFFHSLHFETCYYQGIEYCIQQGLKTFEPGAQGEHKIARGFLPIATYSAHWLTHSDFNNALRVYVDKENHLIKEQMRQLGELSPYHKQ